MANERRGSPAARLHALGGFLRSRLAMGRLPDWYEVNAAIEELDEIGSAVVALEQSRPPLRGLEASHVIIDEAAGLPDLVADGGAA